MSVFRYSPEQLRLLGNGACSGLPRDLKRFLFHLGISNRAHVGSAAHNEVRRIPTRITSRRRRKSGQAQPSSRQLTRVRVVAKRREKKLVNIVPSLLLTNVRSLSSKMDELEVRVSNVEPDIIILTESSLDAYSVSDSAVHLDNYSILRRDCNNRGGGVICYVSEVFQPVRISHIDVPSLGSCSSELLALFISSINLLVIAIYHPFWGNRLKNDEAIDSITDIIDFSMTNLSNNNSVKVFLCGDFNDLRHSYEHISRVAGLSPLVTHPTRGEHVLQ